MSRDNRLPGRTPFSNPDHARQPDSSNFTSNPNLAEQPFLSRASNFANNTGRSGTSALSSSSDFPSSSPLSSTSAGPAGIQPTVSRHPMSSSSLSDQRSPLTGRRRSQALPSFLQSQPHLTSRDPLYRHLQQTEPTTSEANRVLRESRISRVPERPPPRRRAFPVSSASCNACLDRQINLIWLGCGHAYCVPCLNRLVEIGLKNKPSFPPRCCSPGAGPVDVPLFINHMTESNIRRYERVSEEFSDPNPTYCANKHCSVYLKPPHPNVSQEKFLVCSSCQVETCNDCKQNRTSHTAELCPKPEDLMNVQDQALAKEKKWKQCIKCKNLIEKIEGCNHMACPCGAHFCYRCGESTGKHVNYVCKCVRERSSQTLPSGDSLGELGDYLVRIRRLRGQLRDVQARPTAQRIPERRNALTPTDETQDRLHPWLLNQSTPRFPVAQFDAAHSTQQNVTSTNERPARRAVNVPYQLGSHASNRAPFPATISQNATSSARSARREECIRRLERHAQPRQSSDGRTIYSSNFPPRQAVQSSTDNTTNRCQYASSARKHQDAQNLHPSYKTSQEPVPQAPMLRRYLTGNDHDPVILTGTEDAHPTPDMFNTSNNIGKPLRRLEYPHSQLRPTDATQNQQLNRDIRHSTNRMLDVLFWIQASLSSEGLTNNPEFDPGVDMTDWDYSSDKNQDS